MYYAIGVSAPCITFNIVSITETSWLHVIRFISGFISLSTVVFSIIGMTMVCPVIIVHLEHLCFSFNMGSISDLAD